MRIFWNLNILILLLIAGCATQSVEKKRPSPDRWQNINRYLYQLQNLDIPKAAASDFDLIIMDWSRDGSEMGRYSPEEIQRLQSRSGKKKIVLAYMSIGEAEDYRWYWNKRWDYNRDGQPDTSAPGWLGVSNPDWPGNYKVKYWNPLWQRIIFGTPDSYLDQIIETGFDGVYLDIVDAFEYWGPGGESGIARKTARQEMIRFISQLAHYARVVKRKPDFGVFPQNGEALLEDPDYRKTITGIGKESTWFSGDSENAEEYITETLFFLDRLHQMGKPVLVIDYPQAEDHISSFYKKARGKNYIPYSSNRALDRMTPVRTP